MYQVAGVANNMDPNQTAPLVSSVCFNDKILSEVHLNISSRKFPVFEWPFYTGFTVDLKLPHMFLHVLHLHLQTLHHHYNITINHSDVGLITKYLHFPSNPLMNL